MIECPCQYPLKKGETLAGKQPCFESMRFTGDPGGLSRGGKGKKRGRQFLNLSGIFGSGAKGWSTMRQDPDSRISRSWPIAKNIPFFRSLGDDIQGLPVTLCADLPAPIRNPDGLHVLRRPAVDMAEIGVILAGVSLSGLIFCPAMTWVGPLLDGTALYEAFEGPAAQGEHRGTGVR